MNICVHDTLLVIRNGIFDKYLAGAQRTFPMSVSFLRLHSILFSLPNCSIEAIDNISQKLSFTELSICRFATNILSISSKLAAGSPNAQLGKTQFF